MSVSDIKGVKPMKYEKFEFIAVLEKWGYQSSILMS